MRVFSTLFFVCFFEQPVLSWAKQVGTYSAYKRPTALLTTFKPGVDALWRCTGLRFPFERSCAELSGFPTGGEVQSEGYLTLAIHPMTLRSISILQKSDGVQSPQSNYSIKDIIKRLLSQVWDRINSKNKTSGTCWQIVFRYEGLSNIHLVHFLASLKSSSVWPAVETVAGPVSLDQIWKSERNALVMKSTNQWSHFKVVCV